MKPIDSAHHRFPAKRCALLSFCGLGLLSLTVFPASASGQTPDGSPECTPLSDDSPGSARSIPNAPPPDCPIELEGVVATGTRIGSRAIAPGVRVEVIEGEALRRSGSAELATALANRTGIELQAGHPTGVGVMVQGMDGRRVLVLVDGKPLVGRLSGVQDLSRIPLSAVDRIEVVRGPQAALYGSDALGGVVNVLTRRAGYQPVELTADMTIGSAGRIEGQGEARGSIAGLGYLLGGGYRQDDLVPGLQNPIGGTHRHDVRLRVDREGPVRWEFGGLVLSDELEWRSGQLRNFSRGIQWSGQLRSLGTVGAGEWTMATSAAGFRQRSGRTTLTAGPTEALGSVQEEGRWEAEAVIAHPVPLPFLGRSLEVEAGIETHRSNIRADRVEDGRQEESGIDLFTQGSVPAGRVTLIPALRGSVRTGNPAHWVPEIGARIPLSSSGSLLLRAAGGYRVADLRERALTFLNVGPGFGYRVNGNPDLRPERSTHLGADFQWMRGGFTLDVRAFHNGYRDFIETRMLGDSAGITIYQYQNAARGRTTGIEVDLRRNAGVVQIDGGIGILSARDTHNDRPLLGRSPITARLGMTLPELPLGFHGHMAVVHTGATPIQHQEAEVDETSTGGTQDRDPFTRIDLSLTRALPGALEVTVGAVNVLDTRPQHWPSSPERLVYLNLSFGPLP